MNIKQLPTFKCKSAKMLNNGKCVVKEAFEVAQKNA